MPPDLRSVKDWLSRLSTLKEAAMIAAPLCSDSQVCPVLCLKRTDRALAASTDYFSTWRIS